MPKLGDLAQQLTAKQKAMIAVMVVLVLASIIRLGVWIFGGPPEALPLERIEQAYYYDMKAKTLFASEPGQIPPIEAPSGGVAALAYVFACQDCDDDSDRQVGYVFAYTPEAKKALEQAEKLRETKGGITAKLQKTIEAGELVFLLDDLNKGVPKRTKAGSELIMKARSRTCPKGALRPCYP